MVTLLLPLKARYSTPLATLQDSSAGEQPTVNLLRLNSEKYNAQIKFLQEMQQFEFLFRNNIAELPIIRTQIFVTAVIPNVPSPLNRECHLTCGYYTLNGADIDYKSTSGIER